MSWSLSSSLVLAVFEVAPGGRINRSWESPASADIWAAWPVSAILGLARADDLDSAQRLMWIVEASGILGR